jgi:hypothetical protein
MNETINHLFGKALDQAVPETWTNLTYEQLTRFKDKFAELIVRECADIVAEHYDASEPWITPKTLLYHFGVEE